MLTREDVPIENDEVAALYVGHTLEWAKGFAHSRTEVAGVGPDVTKDEEKWERELCCDKTLAYDPRGYNAWGRPCSVIRA